MLCATTYICFTAASQVLLATVLLKIIAPDGTSHIVRGLVYQGSQVTLVTEDVVQRLQLKKIKNYTTISGVGASDAGVSTSMVKLAIQPPFQSTFIININGFVLSKLTRQLPNRVGMGSLGRNCHFNS